MAKTTEIIKAAVVLALVLGPLNGASSVEELERKNAKLEAELAQLKEMFSAFQEKLNDTEDLETRVTVLEESMVEVEEDVVVLQTSVVNLADEVDNVESVNILQDDRINTLEAEIFDNENDIEELVDITTGLTIQVSGLQEDLISLDQRVGDLESGGGGSDLEERVETLEQVTSQLTDDMSSLEDNDVTQDEIISSIEEDMTSLDQRVEDLESNGGGNVTDYSDSIFMAALLTPQHSDRDPLVFDYEVINPGRHYNSETGRYTVPYDGIYQFSVHLQVGSNTETVRFNLEVDDSTIDSHVDGFSDIHRSTTILLQLLAGQTVHVTMFNQASGTTSNFRSYFNGYLISPNN